MTSAASTFSRRRFLTTTAATAAGLCAPSILSIPRARAQGTRDLNMQLGWIASGNQLGEVVAKKLGYFEEEGLNFAIQPGGPNVDGVAIVASGRFQMGQVSSSPSLMLAASQGVPVKAFAVSAQQHPYAFFSLGAKPVKSAADMVGKRVGIQGTGRPLLSALLRANDVPEDEVEVVVIGSDMSPLLTDQVDAIAGWVTNTTALSVLGDHVVTTKLWDNGVQLYANPYYATADTIENDTDLLASFLRGSGRGWAYAYENRDEAVKLLVEEYPNLVEADERAAADVMLAHVFTETTAKDGWATFDPAVWQRQIEQYAALDQFSAGAPALEDVIDDRVLVATADARPKIG